MVEIYLDNGATSFPKPEAVYKEIDNFMRNNGANPGRGNYARALEAERAVYDTRKALAKLFGISEAGHIIFTSNVTESLNLVLKGFVKTGDEVLTSNIEHNAMWRPLKKMEREQGVIVKTFYCQPDGTLNLDAFDKLLTPQTRLVAFLHGSNVIGNIFPLEEMTHLAQAKGIAVLVDAAQTAGAMPIEVEKNGIDFFAFTGHKSLMGPTGTGGVYISSRYLDTLKEGGTGSMSKSPFQPEDPPDRFEAGTLNVFGLIGLKAAINYILNRGLDQIRAHEISLIEHLLTGLKMLPEVQVYGPTDLANRLGLVCFNCAKIDPYQITSRLDKEFGIMTRAGLHCSPQAHRLIGTDQQGTVRASVGAFSTHQDIEMLLKSLKIIISS